MTHALLIVEGAHDASFFGHLARMRGYRAVRTMSEMPEFWRPLIPTRYPVDDAGNLDRVIPFPEVHTDPGSNTLGVIVAGGDSRLVEGLRIPLERLGTGSFTGIGIALDTDLAYSARERFDSIVAKLVALNRDAVGEGVPGFPLPLPTSPGPVKRGSREIGIHQFPDNVRQGSLETVLLELRPSVIHNWNVPPVCWFATSTARRRRVSRPCDVSEARRLIPRNKPG